MLFLKKLPWISLTLVLLTYFNFGWVLSDTGSPKWLWVVATICILLLAEALASPSSIVRTSFVRWVKSERRAFITVVIGAFLAVVFFSWFNISAQGLLLVAASCVARLDLHAAGFKAWQDFFILAFVNLLGLSLGWGLHIELMGNW